MWYEKLLPEQEEACDFVLDRLSQSGGAGLFSEQGTGKTIVSLAVLEKIKWRRILIVAPLTALEVTWRRRLRSTFPACRLYDSLDPALRNPEASGALVLHFQAFSRLAAKLARIKWDLVLIDESQGIKNRNSGWSRAARKLRHVKNRLALSGTPIDENEIEVWAQMRFIDHTVLGDKWGDFAEEYCRRAGFMGKQWKFRKEKRKKFLAKLRPYIYRLSADFLKLPPMTLHLLPVMMLGRQRRYYDRFEQRGFLKIGQEVIKSEMEGTKQIKLAQMTGGQVLSEDGVAVVGQAKERKLRYLITRLKPPIVVCCRFRHEIRSIQELAGQYFERVAGLHGQVKDTKKSSDRTKVLDNFQAGRIDLLVCQQRTGGVSVEFTKARNLIIYSMGHSFIDFSQFLARLQRFGQDKSVNVFLIFAENSIDEEIIETISDKSENVKTIIGYFERASDMSKERKKAAKPKAVVKKNNGKADEKVTKKAASKKPAAEAEFKYGVMDLAKILDVSPQYARTMLRKAEVDKAGKSYGWNSEKELKAVAAQLQKD